MHTWRPLPEDFGRVIAEQNLWRFTGGAVHSPRVLPRERFLADSLAKLLLHAKSPRHQLLVGPRRVGKTAVLYETVRYLLAGGVEPERICWLRMDHPALVLADLGEQLRGQLYTGRLTSERPLYLIIDEIAYVGQWDRNHLLTSLCPELGSVRIAAASSSIINLHELSQKIGVGQFDVRYVAPYSFGQYLELATHEAEVNDNREPAPSLGESLRRLREGFLPRGDLTAQRREFLLLGGFPELLDQWSAELRKGLESSGVAQAEGGHQVRDGGGLEEPRQPVNRVSVSYRLMEQHLVKFQQLLRSANVEQVLYRDLRLLLRVNSPHVLERLLYVLAAQVASVLSPARICSYLGISQPTFDRYLSYLEQAFIVFALPNYPRRRMTAVPRGRKLYFVDGAVRNAVLQRGLVAPDDPSQHELPAKNLMVSELRTLAVHCDAPLYHWREGNQEVDVIFDHPSDPLAFEFASSPRHTREGLRELAHRHEQFRGRCFLVAPRLPVMHPPAGGTDPGTLPLDTFLLAVGAQAHEELRRSLLFF